MPTYPNETFSGCDITAAVTFVNNMNRVCSKIIGSLQTVSYSINVDRVPVRSIGNINAKDYIQGQRTIAGSMVFTVFNKHFAQEIIKEMNSNFNGGRAFLVDELPPFNLIISAANEYGCKARLVIYGIRFVNEGQVMSINDIYTENTYQYFATDVEYLNDENVYVRTKDNILYLEDKDSIKSNTIPKSEQIQNNLIKMSNNDINLSVNVKNPKNRNVATELGLVSFYLNPKQEHGFINIENLSDMRKYKIAVNSNNSLYIELPVGKYKAIFENGKSKSNNVMFNVITDYKANVSNNSKPIVEYLDDKKIKLYSNNPSHDIMKIIDEKGSISVKDIKNNKVEFNNLEPFSRYAFMSAKKNELETSDVITTKTVVPNFKKQQLLSFINSNKKELSIPSNIYIDFINSIDGNDIIEEFNNIKEKKLLKLKEKRDSLEDEKIQLEIEVLKDLINISIRLTNDFYNFINRHANNVNYSNFIDSNGNNNIILKSNADTITANYFLNGKYKKDKVYNIDSLNIHGKNRAIVNPGKNDKLGFCIAKYNNQKNNRIYFYNLNNEDRKKYIETSKRISNTTIDFCEKEIDNFFYKTNTSPEIINTLYLYQLKKNKHLILFPPKVIDIDKENIYIKLDLYYLFNKKQDKKLYITVASYEDCKNNKFFYKYEYNNIFNEDISIDRRILSIQNYSSYAIWIEDEDNNMISNLSVFYVGKDELEYEQAIYSYMIEDSLLSNKKISTSEIKEKNEMFLNTLKLEDNNFLYDRKKIIFSMFSTTNNESFIFDILKLLKNEILLNLKKTDIFNIDYVNDYKIKLKENNNNNYVIFDVKNKKVLNLDNVEDYSFSNSNYLVAYCIDKDVTCCSNLYLINVSTNEWRMI